MTRARKPGIFIYWLLTALACICAAALAALYAPVESSMGLIQKIFYVHLPSAINTFLAFAVVFVASIGYLIQRKAWWDDLAAAAAKTGVLFCSVVLLTGMTWAKGAWGVWWTWSPRLTFSLLLWLLYVVYLLTRSSIDSRQRKAMIAAVYGIVAFLDVPLVYLSARLLPEVHPASVALAREMKLTLAVCFIPVTLLNVGIIAALFARATRARDRQHEEAASQPRPMNLQRLGGAA